MRKCVVHVFEESQGGGGGWEKTGSGLRIRQRTKIEEENIYPQNKKNKKTPQNYLQTKSTGNLRIDVGPFLTGFPGMRAVVMIMSESADTLLNIWAAACVAGDEHRREREMG